MRTPSPLVLRSLWLLTMLSLLSASSRGQALQLGDLSWQLLGAEHGSASLTHSTMSLVGPDGLSSCAPHGKTISYTTRAPAAGTLHARLDWSTLDVDSFEVFDYLFFERDGVQSVLAWGETAAKTVVVITQIPEGAEFGFGIHSVDCQAGPGMAVISGFSFHSPGGVPEFWVDEGEAHDPREVFSVPVDPLFASLGSAVALPGDLDGDSRIDVVAGRAFNSTVHAYSMTTGFELWTAHRLGNFGHALTSLADVDGDGVAEVAVSNPNADSVTLLSGLDGSELWSRSFGTLAKTGWSLDAISDLNGDGVDDLIVGTRAITFPPPAVHVLSGVDGAVIHVVAPQPGDNDFGRAVARAGVVDDDAFEDFLVGAPGFPSRARVFSGATGEPLLLLEPHDGIAFDFGTSVRGAGDLTGDGIAELLVAAPHEPWPQAAPLPFLPDVGSVTLFDGSDGEVLNKVWGALDQKAFGRHLVGDVDVDGDAQPDFVASFVSEFDDASGMRVVRPLDGVLLAELEFDASSAITSLAHASSSVGLFATGVPFNSSGPSVAVWSELLLPGALELSATGLPAPSWEWSVTISRGVPQAAVFLVLGASALAAPFHGGVLVPAPDVVQLRHFDAAGEVHFGGTWPNTIGILEQIWVQAWSPAMSDPSVWSSSNALLSVEVETR